MNTIGIALLWCAVQVTLIGLLAAGLYLLVRRLRPSAAASVVLTGLVMVVLLSLLAPSAWPRWTIRTTAHSPVEVNVSPLPLGDGQERNGSPLPLGEGQRRNGSPRPLGEGQRRNGSPRPLGEGQRRNGSPRPLGEGQGVRAVASHTAAEPPLASEHPATPRSDESPSTANHPSAASLLWQALTEQFSTPQPVAPANDWRWPAVIGVLLLAAMTCGLAWLLLGVIAVRSQRARSRPVLDKPLLELIDVLRAELGCRRPVEVRQSDDLTTAATIGWRRPAVLLPGDWTAWTPEQRRAVLAHEIAHARSHDFLALLLGQLGLVLHFYHPLVHWLMNRLRLEQELAADAAAASVSGGQRHYLTTIAELALRQEERPLLWPARAFLPTRTTFLRRIAMLRDSKLRFDRLSPVTRWTTVGAVLLCGLSVAGLRGPGNQSQALADDAAKAPEGSKLAKADAAAGGIDLNYVPTSAIGFVAIRSAAIFKRPELAAFGKLLGVNGGYGVPPIELDQLTGVVLCVSLPEKPPGYARLVIYQTTKPSTFEQCLRGLPDAQKKEFEGKTYLVSTSRPYAGAIFRPDDRTLVWASSETTLQKFFQAGKGLPEFVDAKRWEQFQVDDAVAAVGSTAFAQFLQYEKLGPLWAPFSPLWQDTSSAIGGIRIADNVLVHGIAIAKDASSAENVEKTLEAARVLATNMVQAMKKQLAPVASASGVPPYATAMFDIYDSALTALNTSREGAAIRLQGSLELAKILKALPPIATARASAQRMQAANNMKMLAIAMHNYAATFKRFPPAVLYGPDGKTPYSWRVALLPYLEGGDLYKQYHFDEPWDGPNNRKLLDKMPAVFRCPTEPAETKNPSYFVLTGPGTMFDGKEGTSFGQITDGTSNTILLVEAKRDIPWTKPEDIPYDPDKPLPKLGGYFEGGFIVALADGSVQFLSSTASEKVLRLLITKADRQPVNVADAMPKPATAVPSTSLQDGRHTAIVSLRVTFSDARGTTDRYHYEVYKKTQGQLIVSRFVLSAALQNPELAELPSVQKATVTGDAVNWLQHQLRVDSPENGPANADLITVSASCEDPREAATLVNVVVDTYLKEVVNAERDQKQSRLDELDRAYAERDAKKPPDQKADTVLEQMAKEREKLKAELAVRPRVMLLQKAQVPENPDKR